MAHRKVRRKAFADELARDMIEHPVSLAIAQLAGRIEGEQAAKGSPSLLKTLVIGQRPFILEFDVTTHNVKHFQAIPGPHCDHALSTTESFSAQKTRLAALQKSSPHA